MSANHRMISGNIVPTISYFDENGKIQESVCRLQASHALYQGVDSLFVLGSTGEGTYLKALGKDHDVERIKLILITADAIAEFKEKFNKAAGILIGAYGDKSDEVIDDMNVLVNGIDDFFKEHKMEYKYLSKILRNTDNSKFSSLIFDGFVVPPPLKNKLDDSKLTDFYKGVLEKTEYPVYMYNNPGTFAGNTISSSVISDLKSYPLLYGIKDSSGTLEQKLEYIKFIGEKFSVSCGKEGMIGTFLKSIPKEMRKFAGIVPSLSNLTNNPSQILKLGLEGKDEEMIKEQEDMNNFRGKLYDSSQSKGKAQRGVKNCFKIIYGSEELAVSLFVRPEMQKIVDEETINSMKQTLDFCHENCYINLIK